MTTKRGPGRPRKEIDLELLDILAAAHVPYETMARALKIHPDTLADNYSERIKEAQAAGKVALHQGLWQAALIEHNIAAMIFLAKVYLGMADKVRVEVALPPDEGELKHLTVKQLEALQAILRAEPVEIEDGMAEAHRLPPTRQGRDNGKRGHRGG